ncbi:peptide deformylase [Candidatus Mycoplasma pogonae]
MSKKPVYLPQLPNNVLRKKSVDVPIPLVQEDIELAEQMIDHIDYSQNDKQTIYRPGIGVAAVQYGILKNAFYIHVPDSEKLKGFRDVLFNPKILGTSDSWIALANGEGCLSVPEDHPKQEGYVHRKSRIIVEAYSYFQKKVVTFKVSGFISIVFQHELDHLQGKLFIDHLDKKNPWKKRSNCLYIN